MALPATPLLHAGAATRGSTAGTGALLPLPDLPGLLTGSGRLLLSAGLLTLLTWGRPRLTGSRTLLTRGLPLLPLLPLLPRGLAGDFALLAWRSTLLARRLTLLAGGLPLLPGGSILSWRGRLLPLGRTGLTDTGAGTTTLGAEARAGLVGVFARLLFLADTLPNRWPLIDFPATRLSGTGLLRAAHAWLPLARTGGAIRGRTGTRRGATGTWPVQGDQRHRKRESKRRAGCLQSCPHKYSWIVYGPERPLEKRTTTVV